VGVVFWSWSRRRQEPANIFKTLAFSFSVFFVLAPGFGAQYLLWPAPFFLAAADWWYLALTVMSSVGLFMHYNAAGDGHIPWDKATHIHRTIAVWGPWVNLCWFVFAGYVVRTVQQCLPVCAQSLVGPETALLEATEEV
jgi:hypothetical protein